MGKESLYGIDKRLILRETFNSEQDCIRNGGTSTDITFSNGIGVFNGSSSKVIFPIKQSVKSIRLKINLSTTTQNILKLSSTHSISVSSGTLSATGFSSPAIYIDGVATSTLTTGWHDVIITTATGITANDIQLGYITTYLTGSINLFEFYNAVLTANEVLLLYENALYREPVFSNEIFSVDSRDGTIVDKHGNSISNTNVSIVRCGSIYCQKYNGTSSFLDLGNPISFQNTANRSLVMWFYAKGFNGNQRYLYDGGYWNGPNYGDQLPLQTLSNEVSISVRNSVDLENQVVPFNPNNWNCIAYTLGSGSIKYYINGVVYGDTDTFTGNLISSDSNKFIGKRSSNISYFNGNIAVIKITNSTLSAKTIQQYYSSTKHYFDK